jgi:hypothetical protein
VNNDGTRPTSGWQFAAFREWHRREHPRTAYLVKPHVWTADGLQRAEGKSALERVNLKNCEPTLTGITFADSHVYLVLVVDRCDEAAIGRLLYRHHLFRRDPDYGEHHTKHHHRLILSRSAGGEMIDFAHAHRISVVVLEAAQPMRDETPREELGDSRAGPDSSGWVQKEAGC